ncbi:MAG: YceI family protein [Gammaproteobacteria bacterium]|nr:YceI family protein [Gammaproteobacteria bacterium]
MRKLVIAAALMALPFTAFGASYTIDPDHTFPHFKISHLGFSTMFGRFNKSAGKLTFDEANGTGSVEITIDAASIDTAHEKRNQHLRSPDFLNTAEFPTITFKSSKANIKGGKGTVEGELTMMGVAKPVTLTVTHMQCGVHPFNKKELCGFDATANIKRSDFGVKYGLPGIGDNMELMFEVEAFKN